MTPYRVQVYETIVHEIDVEAESDEAAGELAHAVFEATNNRPPGTYVGSIAGIVTNLTTGKQRSLVDRDE